MTEPQQIPKWVQRIRNVPIEAWPRVTIDGREFIDLSTCTTNTFERIFLGGNPDLGVLSPEEVVANRAFAVYSAEEITAQTGLPVVFVNTHWIGPAVIFADQKGSLVVHDSTPEEAVKEFKADREVDISDEWKQRLEKNGPWKKDTDIMDSLVSSAPPIQYPFIKVFRIRDIQNRDNVIERFLREVYDGAIKHDQNPIDFESWQKEHVTITPFSKSRKHIEISPKFSDIVKEIVGKYYSRYVDEPKNHISTTAFTEARETIAKLAPDPKITHLGSFKPKLYDGLKPTLEKGHPDRNNPKKSGRFNKPQNVNAEGAVQTTPLLQIIKGDELFALHVAAESKGDLTTALRNVGFRIKTDPQQLDSPEARIVSDDKTTIFIQAPSGTTSETLVERIKSFQNPPPIFPTRENGLPYRHPTTVAIIEGAKAEKEARKASGAASPYKPTGDETWQEKIELRDKQGRLQEVSDHTALPPQASPTR